MSIRHCLVVLVLLTSALSQNSETKGEPPPAPAQKRNWSDVWRNATVAFGEILTDKLTQRPYFHAIGAGVIIGVDKNTAYLVTVRHMFCDSSKRFYPSELHVRFAWQEHQSIYDYLGVSLPLRNDAGANLWSSLDDGSDLAAIEWHTSFFNDLPPAERAPTDAIDAIGFNDVAGGAFEGESIYVLGYPEVVANEKLVRAIMRQGIVAWTNPNDPDDRTFLVDASVVPGNSGGPIIKFPFGLQKDGTVNYISGGKLQLLGLVSEAWSEEFNIRSGNQGLNATVKGVGAIGEIEPSGRIRKLITAIQQGKLKAAVCDVDVKK
jgi:hypothetical protein